MVATIAYAFCPMNVPPGYRAEDLPSAVAVVGNEGVQMSVDKDGSLGLN